MVVRLCERKVALTQHRALGAPVWWWVVSPGGEAAKGLAEDAPGPGRFLACWGHIVAGRAEARAAASRIFCLAVRVVEAEPCGCVGPNCVGR